MNKPEEGLTEGCLIHTLKKQGAKEVRVLVQNARGRQPTKGKGGD